MNLYLLKIRTVVMAVLILVLFLSMSIVEARGSALSLKNFEIFEDTEGTLSFDAVSSADFQPYGEDTIFLGISRSAFWVRFVLPDNSYGDLDNRYLLEMDNPSISKIDMYLPVAQKDGSISTWAKAAGSSEVCSKKNLESGHRHFSAEGICRGAICLSAPGKSFGAQAASTSLARKRFFSGFFYQKYRLWNILWNSHCDVFL